MGVGLLLLSENNKEALFSLFQILNVHLNLFEIILVFIIVNIRRIVTWFPRSYGGVLVYLVKVAASIRVFEVHY